MYAGVVSFFVCDVVWCVCTKLLSAAHESMLQKVCIHLVRRHFDFPFFFVGFVLEFLSIFFVCLFVAIAYILTLICMYIYI